MKRVVQEITEVYEYKSFAEFEEHYAEMIKGGYQPNSDSCKPEYYCNCDLKSYLATYRKCVTNY